MIYNNVLNELISREIAGIDYLCPNEDRNTLLDLFKEINFKCNTNIKYLAELDTFHISGAGEIVACYIDKFTSQSIKAYLIPHLIFDKIKDCDMIILKMYENFRQSAEFVSKPGDSSPTHISSRYDGAFYKMKSKRIINELVDVVSCPRDAFYLPLTIKMLASWRIPELKNILLYYLKPDAILMEDVGLYSDNQTYFPSFSYIRNEIIFTAINDLKYYPSQEVSEAIYPYLFDPNCEIRETANRIYKKIIERQGERDNTRR